MRVVFCSLTSRYLIQFVFKDMIQVSNNYFYLVLNDVDQDHDIWCTIYNIVLYVPTSFLCFREEGLQCVKRSDLIETLAESLPTESIRFGCQIVSVETDPTTSFPIVYLGDGSNIRTKVTRRFITSLLDDILILTMHIIRF